MKNLLFNKTFLGYFILGILSFVAISTYAQSPLEETFNMYDVNNDDRLSRIEFRELYEGVFGHQGEAEDHGHSHRSMNKELRKIIFEVGGAALANKKDSTTITNKLDTRDHEENCPLPDELFFEFSASGSFLFLGELEDACPKIVLMIIQNCIELHYESHEECSDPESWEAWLSALASVIVITLITLIGIILIPVTFRWPIVTKTVLMIMISFAVGALVGDAIYHLIPIALEVHSHDSHSEEEGGEEEEEDKDYLGVLTLVIVGILFFFIMESVLHIILGEDHAHSDSLLLKTDKDKEEEEDEIIEIKDELDNDNNNDDNDDDDDDEESQNSSSSSDSEVPSDGSEVPMANSKKNIKNQVKGSFIKLGKGASNEVKRLKFVKNFGWLNLVADGFHNFMDGIAIGVAYSTSLTLGLGTTIAVGMHEIPQELGDFSILLNAGFSKTFAVLFNLLSGCLAVLGTLIGVAVGENANDSEKWILAFTAGGFLYIALSDMVHEVHAATRKKTWWGILDLSIQIFAMLIGFTILFIIAYYEDDIITC